MNNSTSFACDMSAMTQEERTIHMHVTRVLLHSVATVSEVAGGYAFQLPAEKTLLIEVGTFIALERLCCPFLGFSLVLAPGAESFSLHVTGPDGVRPFIRSEFQAALPESAPFPDV